MSAEAERSQLQVPWRRLDGKVIMVTGASSGLGREFALDLAKAGCLVIAAARRTDRLKSLCGEIDRLSPPSVDSKLSKVRCVAIELDITQDGASIDASIQKAWDAFGRIDALINNAGVRGNVNSPLDIPEGEWNNVIKTNITGSWLVSKSVGARMRDAKQRGSIINISSISGLDRGQFHGATAYAVSKAGLNTMTTCMALELGVYGIRVNSVSAGLFRSEITEALMQKEWLNKVALKSSPLRTFGTSDPALTSLIRYLIHDMSEYVTGNIFIVDAGYSLPGVPIFSSL